MKAPAAEVLIPSWNRADSLRGTLVSLLNQTTPPAICVVDNGSSDGTATMLARDFSEVRVVALPLNRGFGAALNEGVVTSPAETVIFINNDAIADQRFVAELLAEREATGTAMIAGCLRDRAGRIESLGVDVDQSLIAYDLGYREPYPEFAQALERAPLGPCGGAAAFSRAAFLSVGGFDEAFFAYLEDVDLAIRMRQAGFDCALAWKAFAWHEHSATLGSGAVAKNRLMGQSRGYLLRKHGSGLTRSAQLRGLLLDGVVYAGQAVLDRNLGAVRGRLEGRKERRGAAAPQESIDLDRLPRVEFSMFGCLRRRLARRAQA